MAIAERPEPLEGDQPSAPAASVGGAGAASPPRARDEGHAPHHAAEGGAGVTVEHGSVTPAADDRSATAPGAPAPEQAGTARARSSGHGEGRSRAGGGGVAAQARSRSKGAMRVQGQSPPVAHVRARSGGPLWLDAGMPAPPGMVRLTRPDSTGQALPVWPDGVTPSSLDEYQVAPVPVERSGETRRVLAAVLKCCWTDLSVDPWPGEPAPVELVLDTYRALIGRTDDLMRNWAIGALRRLHDSAWIVMDDGVVTLGPRCALWPAESHAQLQELVRRLPEPERPELTVVGDADIVAATETAPEVGGGRVEAASAEFDDLLGAYDERRRAELVVAFMAVEHAAEPVQEVRFAALRDPALRHTLGEMLARRGRTLIQHRDRWTSGYDDTHAAALARFEAESTHEPPPGAGSVPSDESTSTGRGGGDTSDAAPSTVETAEAANETSATNAAATANGAGAMNAAATASRASAATAADAGDVPGTAAAGGGAGGTGGASGSGSAAALTQAVRPSSPGGGSAGARLGVSERAVLTLVLVHSVAIPRAEGLLPEDSWLSPHPTPVDELRRHTQLPIGELEAALRVLRHSGLLSQVKAGEEAGGYVPGPQFHRLTPAARRRLQEELILAAGPNTPLATAVRARRSAK
ncbi:hypothetical protein [Nonomuraea sp. NPDC049784]|uniref:hypothetical protein n=1 Tax=Nonomuraea sp. NPDC049784 TaxID=3154361 RepID=UPI0033EE7174